LAIRNGTETSCSTTLFFLPPVFDAFSPNGPVKAGAEWDEKYETGDAATWVKNSS